MIDKKTHLLGKISALSFVEKNYNLLIFLIPKNFVLSTCLKKPKYLKNHFFIMNHEKNRFSLILKSESRDAQNQFSYITTNAR